MPYIKHGQTGTPTYRSWSSMKQRCFNPSHEAFHHYGGRGITVCERWLVFENFLSDMGERPDRTSLERLNNELSYTPENCIWGTSRDQSRNRRNNRLVTWRGKTQPLVDWCEQLKLDYSIMIDRLSCGWSPEKTFSLGNRTVPARGTSNGNAVLTEDAVRAIRDAGVSVPLEVWATKLGISRATVYQIRSGKTWKHLK